MQKITIALPDLVGQGLEWRWEGLGNVGKVPKATISFLKSSTIREYSCKRVQISYFYMH